MIDEISVVTAPLVANKNDKPLFYGSDMNKFKLSDVRKYDEAVWTVYKK